MALLQPGDTILGMSLDPRWATSRTVRRSTASGRLYQRGGYGLDTRTVLIDYDQVERLAREHRPKMIVAGFSAYSRVVDWKRVPRIADKVGAWFFADMAHVAGLGRGRMSIRAPCRDRRRSRRRPRTRRCVARAAA
jgi:glycine hydroxymethyltransferase